MGYEQRVRDHGGIFKDYDLHKVIPVSGDITEMEAVSTNYWLSKFVMEYAKKSVWQNINSQTLFGAEDSTPLVHFPDASDERYTANTIFLNILISKRILCTCT